MAGSQPGRREPRTSRRSTPRAGRARTTSSGSSRRPRRWWRASPADASGWLVASDADRLANEDHGRPALGPLAPEEEDLLELRPDAERRADARILIREDDVMDPLERGV